MFDKFYGRDQFDLNSILIIFNSAYSAYSRINKLLRALDGCLGVKRR